jgi:plastocyanin
MRIPGKPPDTKVGTLRKLIAVLVVAAFLGGMTVLGSSVATGTGSHWKSSPPVKTKTVKVSDDVYMPTKITIYRKDSIKWVWVDPTTLAPGTTDNSHTVTEANDRFTSEEMTSGTYKKKFKKTGTYRIICAVHPDTMRMKVKVKARPS